MDRTSTRIPAVALAALALCALLFALLVEPAAAKKGKKKTPDLVVKKVTGPASAEVGAGIDSKVKVKNKGKKTTKPTKVTLSVDGEQIASTKIGKLKKKKSKQVKLGGNLPADATEGKHDLEACAKPVKGEKRKAKKNNCKSRSLRVPDSGGDYDRNFPERFVGTATATHYDESERTPTDDTGTPASESNTETLEAEVTFTRQGTPGSYIYVSSGKVDWSLNGSDTSPDESCTRVGSGTIPIRSSYGPPADASARINVQGASLAPGSQYTAASFYGFGGGNPTFKLSCSYSGGGGFSDDTTYDPKNWFPAPQQQSSTYQYCTPFAGSSIQNVRADGSLAGQFSCQESFTDERAHADVDFFLTGTWEYALKPMGPAGG